MDHTIWILLSLLWPPPICLHAKTGSREELSLASEHGEGVSEGAIPLFASNQGTLPWSSFVHQACAGSKISFYHQEIKPG